MSDTGRPQFSWAGYNRPFTDPDAAARKIVEIANDVEAGQDGRIFIERVNAPSGCRNLRIRI